jgi:hypothetical protein
MLLSTKIIKDILLLKFKDQKRLLMKVSYKFILTTIFIINNIIDGTFKAELYLPGKNFLITLFK